MNPSLRFHSGTVVGRILRIPLRLVPGDAVLPVLSGPMAGLRWVAGSAPHGAWLGTLERVKLAHFVKSLVPDAVVWDLGANVGLYSLAGARAVGPKGHVFAFEPYDRNLRYLERHRELNRVRNLTIVPRAVYDAPAILRMSSGDSPSEFHVDAEGTCEVEAVSLDGWRQGGEERRPPDVVKIDVEGAEGHVLRGGAGVFSRHRPVIYLSLHGERQREDCQRLLRSWDYELSSLEERVELQRSAEWLARPR